MTQCMQRYICTMKQCCRLPDTCSTWVILKSTTARLHHSIHLVFRSTRHKAHNDGKPSQAAARTSCLGSFTLTRLCYVLSQSLNLNSVVLTQAYDAVRNGTSKWVLYTLTASNDLKIEEVGDGTATLRDLADEFSDGK